MADNKQSGDAASERVQKLVDQEQDQGFRGTKVDPTPNEAYTVQGVTSNPHEAEEASRPPNVQAALDAENTGLKGGVETREK